MHCGERVQRSNGPTGFISPAGWYNGSSLSHSCSSLELAEGFPLDASVLIIVDSFATDKAENDVQLYLRLGLAVSDEIIRMERGMNMYACGMNTALK
jgi:hypothetical protein